LGFGGKTRKKETTLKTKRIWEDNSRMDIKYIESTGVEWVNLAEGRDKWRAVLTGVINLHVTLY
jgi:hypothetical protein